MPQKKNRDEKTEGAVEVKPLPAGLVEQLVTGPMSADDVNAMFRQLKKAVLEKALGAELTHHLGYEKGDPAGRGRGNSRNGTSAKTVLTEDGEVEIAVPRDRAGSFEPQLIAKGQTHFTGFDDKILSLYARGMTVREIQGHLHKAILPAIKAIYRAESADMAMVRLEEFEAEWGKRYPAVGAAWRRAWDYVVPFFAFAPGIR